MKLRARFTLVGLGVLAFVIATPFLVIYARGFQIDWHNFKLIQTGALVVKTEPTKAQIYLNDKVQANLTPTDIKFLAPGDYNVRIEKVGYQSWTKRLSVKSQFVTWTNADRDFVTLFLKNPTASQTYTSTYTSLSRLGDEIVFLEQGQIKKLNVRNGSVDNFGNLGNLRIPNLSGITIKWQDAGGILNTVLATNSNLSAGQLTKIDHAELNGDHVVLTMAGSLYTLDGNNLKLLEKDVQTFTLATDGIWYLQKNFLKHYIFSRQAADTVSNLVPTSKQSEIIRTPNQVYLILDKTLYLSNDSLEKIYSPVTTATWDPVSLSLLYSNDNEIYRYHTDTKNSDLILRNLTPIKNPILNFVTGYVFYQNEGKIKAIELDPRDHHNVYTITDAGDSFTVSNDGKLLDVISGNEIKEYNIR